MPAFCAIYACGSRGDRDSVNFFRIPKVKVNFGEQERELSERRRRLWVSAISRADRKEFGDDARVCSRHFVTGRSAKNWDSSNIDWVPTLCLGHNKAKPQKQENTERDERTKQRRKCKHEREIEKARNTQQFEASRKSTKTPIMQRKRRQSNIKEAWNTRQTEASTQSNIKDAHNIQQAEASTQSNIEAAWDTQGNMEEGRDTRQSEASTQSNIEVAWDTQSNMEERDTQQSEASTQSPETVCHQVQSRSSQTIVNHKNKESQTDLSGQDIDRIVNYTMYQNEQISQLREQADLTNSVSQANLEGNDEKVKYYTGLPTYTLLMAIFNFVSPYIVFTHRSSMSKFQQMMIVFMRLRLNLSECDLAYRFNVAQSTISRIFKLNLDILFIRLKHLIMWPEREELRLTMPVQLQEHFGKRVAVIIDCFEVFIDRPSNLLARAQTWSNYKHHNTIKYLIGITPQGTISFLSNAWGGRTSDKHITENCGFLMNLEPGDLVLADRGFDIAESVGMQCAEVKIPAFTKGKKQLTPAEIETTRKIAHVRIHVERCIGNVRKKYRILGGPIPIDYLDKIDSQGWTTMDKIARLSCALTNLSNSVVSFE